MAGKDQKMHSHTQAKSGKAGAKSAISSLYRKAKAAVNTSSSSAQKSSAKSLNGALPRREMPETIIVEHASPPAHYSPPAAAVSPPNNDQWYRQMMQAKGISR
jgi:hypothetical protein